MNGAAALLWVAAGGALGSVARYVVSAVVLARLAAWRFPVGTFAVNIAGCLLIGVLAALTLKHDLFTPSTRLFLFTGVAGGFTTFSSFGLETFQLLRRGEVLWAGSYVVASVVVGLLALWLGFHLVFTKL